MEALFIEKKYVIIFLMEAQNKKMTRKDFLKLAGGAALMFFVSRLGGLSSFSDFSLKKDTEPGYGSFSYGGKKRT
jgi:hypothetical protein